jgi:hypothetical protein
VIKKQLTKQLSSWRLYQVKRSTNCTADFTSKPLSDETSFALDVVFGDSSGMGEIAYVLRRLTVC